MKKTLVVVCLVALVAAGAYAFQRFQSVLEDARSEAAGLAQRVDALEETNRGLEVERDTLKTQIEIIRSQHEDEVGRYREAIRQLQIRVVDGDPLAARLQEFLPDLANFNAVEHNYDIYYCGDSKAAEFLLSKALYLRELDRLLQEYSVRVEDLMVVRDRLSLRASQCAEKMRGCDVRVAECSGDLLDCNAHLDEKTEEVLGLQASLDMALERNASLVASRQDWRSGTAFLALGCLAAAND